MHPPVQLLSITCTQLNNCLETPLDGRAQQYTTRFVGIITSTIIIYILPLAFHVPIDGGAIIIILLYLLPESCMHVRN